MCEVEVFDKSGHSRWSDGQRLTEANKQIFSFSPREESYVYFAGCFYESWRRVVVKVCMYLVLQECTERKTSANSDIGPLLIYVVFGVT